MLSKLPHFQTLLAVFLLSGFPDISLAEVLLYLIHIVELFEHCILELRLDHAFF